MLGPSPTARKLLADLLVLGALAVATAGLCTALVWIVRFEFVPPRPS